MRRERLENKVKESVKFYTKYIDRIVKKSLHNDLGIIHIEKDGVCVICGNIRIYNRGYYYDYDFRFNLDRFQQRYLFKYIRDAIILSGKQYRITRSCKRNEQHHKKPSIALMKRIEYENKINSLIFTDLIGHNERIKKEYELIKNRQRNIRL